MKSKNRPQIAQVILHRRPGERDPRLRLQRLGGLGPGLASGLDRLRLASRTAKRQLAIASTPAGRSSEP